jgi:hypothetical protein
VLLSAAVLRQVQAWRAGRSWHRARLPEPLMVIQQSEVCRGVRQAAAHRGVQRALRQACRPEPALRSVRVVLLVR